MADKKITELTAHTTVLDADVFAVVNGGTTKQITRANIFNTAISGATFSDAVTINGDFEVGVGYDATFRDTEVGGNFKWTGRLVDATYKGQTAIIPVSNYSMTDNSDTRMIRFGISGYDITKDYVWGISFVFEGQIVAWTDTNDNEVTCQMYKCSVNATKEITSDTANTFNSNFSEDAEPTEASSDSSKLKAYTTTTTVTFPDIEQMDFNLKTNFTGTEAGVADFYAHGVVRVFHFCRNLTDNTNNGLTVSMYETA